MRTAGAVMGPREWLLLLVLATLWGGSFFLGKVAIAELHPFSVVLGRVALAAVALNLLVRVSGRRMSRTPATWGALLVMGALNNVIPFSLIFWSQTWIDSGLAAILNATTPLFTILLAHALTDERLTAGRLGGVLFGLIGVAVMIGPEALTHLGSQVVAQLMVLGAACSYGCASIFGRRFRGTPPLVTAAGQVSASAALMLPLALLADRPWELPLPHFQVLGAVAGLALLSTTIAYVIYFRLLAAAGPTNLVLVTLLIPVSALLLGTTILGERLEARSLAGMALIALALASVDGRPLALLRARVRPRLVVEKSAA